MRSRLDYIWRLAGTGLAFAFFSLGGLLLTLTVFPVIAIVSRRPERRVARTRKMIHYIFRLFILMLRSLRVIDLSLEGGKRLHETRGRLVVANHPSLLDVVLLIAHMPKAQCIVKNSLLHHRFFGGVLRAAGYISNERDPEELLRQCKLALDLGHDIVVFPEGTRSTPGQAIKFQRGFANIALLSACNIQPVVITCWPTTLTKGSKWYDIPPSRAKFHISVEEELDIERFLRHEPRSKVVRKLTRELEHFYSGKVSHG